MSALKLVFLGFLALLGSVARAFVVGFVNPTEKVKGLWLFVAAAFYGMLPQDLSDASVGLDATDFGWCNQSRSGI
jgi:hypothetical protein